MNNLAKLCAIDRHSALSGRERTRCRDRRRWSIERNTPGRSDAFRLNGDVHDRHSQRIVRFRRGQSVGRASTTPMPISYSLDRAPLWTLRCFSYLTFAARCRAVFVAETKPETAAPNALGHEWSATSRSTGRCWCPLWSSTDIPAYPTHVRFALESSRTHRRTCPGDAGTKLCPFERDARRKAGHDPVKFPRTN